MKTTSSLALSLLILSVFGLAAGGIVMLSSASAAEIGGTNADVNHFLRKQVGWLLFGLLSCGFFSVMDYRRLRPLVWPAFIFCLILLSLCFAPGIGHSANGSARWIDLRFAKFQPSEAARVCTLALLSHWYARHERRSGTFLHGILIPFMILGAPAALILKEVDLGATALLSAAGLILMFIAGASLKYLAPIFVAGAMATVIFASTSGERADRMLAFLNLEEHKSGAGWQQYQGLIALGSGGVDGLGLGLGRQKMHYIPEAHNDFIFAVVGEELGIKATLSIVFAYVVLVACGTIIALNAPDRFGSLLGAGFVVLLGLQAITNLGVVTALLPNKGIPLPFVSYGGSNLLVCLSIIGVLIGIHRQSVFENRAAYTAVLNVNIRDKQRRARDRGGL